MFSMMGFDVGDVEFFIAEGSSLNNLLTLVLVTGSWKSIMEGVHPNCEDVKNSERQTCLFNMILQVWASVRVFEVFCKTWIVSAVALE